MVSKREEGRVRAFSPCWRGKVSKSVESSDPYESDGSILSQGTATRVLDHVSIRNRSAVMLGMESNGCKDANYAGAASPLSSSRLSIGKSVERHDNFETSSCVIVSAFSPLNEHESDEVANGKEVKNENTQWKLVEVSCVEIGRKDFSLAE